MTTRTFYPLQFPIRAESFGQPVDPLNDWLRYRAQSHATRNGKLAPLPATVEEARRILATQPEEKAA